MSTIREFKITPDSKGEDLASFAMVIHDLIRLPITIRSLNAKGVRVEDGHIIDYSYSGPILEQVLKENRVVQAVPKTGAFKGKSVVAAPIRDDNGNVVAAIALSDAYGALDFIECLCRHQAVIEDVEKCLLKKRVNVFEE